MAEGPTIRPGNEIEVLGETKYHFDSVDIGHGGVHRLSRILTNDQRSLLEFPVTTSEGRSRAP